MDADGEYLNSQCFGYVYTDFWITPTVLGQNLHTCRAQSTNVPNADGASTYAVDGIVRGKGRVQRYSFSQPSYPAGVYCGSSQKCVWASMSSQRIRIEPIALKLHLTATPSSIVEGDSVLFQATTDGGLALSVREWIWVPDVVDTTVIYAMRVPSMKQRAGTQGDSVRTLSPSTEFKRAQLSLISNLDPRTVYCTGTNASCKIPIFQSGRMYMRAVVGSGSGQVLEQAVAVVQVTRLSASMSCVPTPVLRDTQGGCTVTVTPSNDGSLVSNWKFSPLSTLLPEVATPDTQFTWAGTIVTDGTVSASAHIRGRDTTLSASIAVQPRDWTSQLTLSVQDSVPNPLDVDSLPTSFHQFGASFLGLAKQSLNFGHVNDHGPNHNYNYYKQFPWSATVLIAINEKALDSTGAYASTLPLSRSTVGGVTYCARGDLASVIRPAVIAHEGTSTPAAHSHVGVFTDTASELTRRLAEPWVRSGSTNWIDLMDTIRLGAANASRRVADTLFPPPTPCVLPGISY